MNDLIVNLVPNEQTFREALRFMKCWSAKRGLKNNMLGYFGGIVWAILVARVCQLYPNQSAAVIVARFFKIFSKWSWPNPVLGAVERCIG